jgi:hypothetical protein
MDRIITSPVPDYFQEDNEEALRSRVQWLEAEVSLGDPFFARLLRTDEGTFTRWRERRAALPGGQLGGLREVWEMMMHILSFVNFDSGRARRLLEHVLLADSRPLGASQSPPWAGSSIKRYLETHGHSSHQSQYLPNRAVARSKRAQARACQSGRLRLH